MLKFEEVFEELMNLRTEAIAVIIAILVISVALIILNKTNKLKMDTRVVVYGGISIALAFILSSIKLFNLPQGGTITPASMLPLIIFAIIFGPVPGVIAGVAYGFLQLIQDAFVVHWAQLILDYPLAFGVLGLAGIFKKNIVVGTILGGFLRFASHFVSGFVFFKEYAGDQNPIIYSLVYNGSFMLVEILICIVLAIPLFKRIKSIKMQ